METRAKITQKIGFIGGGNMASAIFYGIIGKNVVDANQIVISGPNLNNLIHFENKGASITTDNMLVVNSCDIVFICIKPQLLNSVVQEINTKCEVYPLLDKIFISILAGISLNKLEKAFRSPVQLIRVMPNTAMAVGEGCSVFAPNKEATNYYIQLVQDLLQCTGLCLQVPEIQIDAIGAVSGSGPAFMYLIMEALADGGVKMGIPRSNAITLASQTMLGAAKMVQQSGKHSAQLKDEVCSPGGTTIAGIHVLEKGAVRGAIIDAVEASTKKALEIGGKSSSC